MLLVSRWFSVPKPLSQIQRSTLFTFQEASHTRPFGGLGLIELDLSDNQLTGEIPPELDNLANLTRLDLSDNQLTGCVPSSLSGQLDMVWSDLGGLLFCP